MKKLVMAMTYKPKIIPFLDENCTQTIRAGRKVSVGDEILFHGWEGRPYWSKWSWRKSVVVTEIHDIEIKPDGIIFSGEKGMYGWDLSMAYTIAREDFIDPPTGEALRDVLFGLNGAPKEPAEYQIIRW